MKKLLMVAGALVFAAMTPGQAKAATITFDLKCTITSSTVCTDSASSFGTVQLVDNGNNVDVTVDLLSGYAERVYLNVDPALGSTGWAISGGGTATYNSNASGPGSYVRFDLNLNPADNTDPVTFTISKTSTNLNPESFLFKDNQSLLYAAVCVAGGDSGSCSSGSFGTGEEQINAKGAKNYTSTGPVNTNPVPEPSALILLGTGLLGLGYGARRRAKVSE